MSYLIPVYIQKRLLRYALSRLDFLDTETLDLDRLDIAWGRNSTVDLKGVALRKDKLSSLLHLPPNLELLSAGIASLRVTVPADLHVASIVVELNRVEARAKLISHQPSSKPAPTKTSISPHTRPSPPPTSPHVPSSRKSSRRKSFSSADEDTTDFDFDDAFPNPHELAQSFLAEEPKAERDQLEAAVNSKSVDLRQSQASTSSGDENLAYGTGVALNLPAFLADFLKGIRDRLQVLVTNLSLKLDLPVDPTSEAGFSHSGTRNSPPETTLSLDVQEICVHRTESARQDGQIDPNPASLTDNSLPVDVETRVGSRCITFTSISGSILSDSVGYSQLSEVLDKSIRDRRENAMVTAFKAATDESESVSPDLQPPQGQFEQAVDLSTSHRDVRDSALLPSMGSQELFADTYADTYSPASSSGSLFNRRPESSFASMTQSTEQTADAHGALRRFREERSLATSKRSSQIGQSIPDFSSLNTSDRPTSPTAPMPGMFQSISDLSRDLHPQSFESFGPSQKLELRDGSEHIKPDDEMVESRLYSHEEAESIYMSAVYDTPPESNTSLNVPGQWTADSTEAPVAARHPPGDSASMDLSENNPLSNSDMVDKAATFHPDHSSLLDDPPQDQIATSLSVEDHREKTANAPPVHHPAEPFLTTPAKRLFRISRGQIWLPDPDQDIETATEVSHTVADTTMNDSMFADRPHVPGSFSMYAESRSFLAQSSSTSKKSAQNPNVSKQQQPATDPPKSRKQVLEVILDTISVNTDATTIKLLYQLLSNFQSVVKVDAKVDSPVTGTGSSQESFAATALKLSIKSLEMNFDENLGERSPNSSEPASSRPSDITDNCTDTALFKLLLKEISLNLNDINSMTHAMLEIGQFKFGFVDEDIISLTRESGLRTSLHDVREIRDKDICIEINKSNGVPNVHIVTQPVAVNINIQKLDNTLGALGGLSGLLELGSSIMSDTTVTGNSLEANQRQRTVHFEPSAKFIPEKARSQPSRLNIKISGSHLTVKSNIGDVLYQSSAIKVVGRGSLIGVQIDQMRLSGPHQQKVAHVAPITLKIREMKLRYLAAPEEYDLTKLISLLTPSKDKFEEDDDFLVDTLIKQRKNGAVLRINVARLEASCPDLKSIEALEELGNEVSKMSAVTKFLPKETRPGVMTLCQINTIALNLESGLKLGKVSSELGNFEIAFVSAPSLIALSLGKLLLESEMNGNIITEVMPQNGSHHQPVLMARMIEDELEPAIRIKMWNLCFEYSVPLLIALMDRDDNATREDIAIDLAKSISGLAELPTVSPTDSPVSNRSHSSKLGTKPLKLDLALRDCGIGLSPRYLPSKGLFVLNDLRVHTYIPGAGKKFVLKLDLRKADVLLIDDIKNMVIEDVALPLKPAQSAPYVKSFVDGLCRQGYVPVASISAATISVSVHHSSASQTDLLDVEFKDKLFVLETCADSTQTLIETLNGLAPPPRPSVGQKYRTEVASVEDMMASFTGDAFAVKPPASDVQSQLDDEDYLVGDFQTSYDEFEEDIDVAPELLSEDTNEGFEDYFTGGIDDLDDTPKQSVNQRLSADESSGEVTGAFTLGDLPPQFHASANNWDSRNNRYIPVRKSELHSSPLMVRVRDTHIIWNLFDGYDWEHTRDTITKAVQSVENQAEERRNNRRTPSDENEENGSVIGDFLFNSIYIGVPVNADPKELSRQINGNLDDFASETGSHTPSLTSNTTSRASNSPRPRPRPSTRKLKLKRSRHHKITFELRGVAVDHFVFLPGGETQSSTDVRIEDVEVFDHVLTSTWKKFATYMQDAGPREDKKPMLHLEICDVRPVPDLTATELVIRVTLLPLRLHVDQDALDFITRFFEFSDTTKPPDQVAAEQPYLQRVEVRPVPVKLDYKPKKVDYAGLRSGRTTEFMNFFSLDAAEFVLKHVVVYGTSGFLKLHRSLEDVWMPDVKKNQLPGVLSGLNGIRTFVNIGAGVRDLVAIPIQEYNKDGRIVRSISKGALAFAKTTGSELTRFGARVAIGAQTVLQGAEGYLAGREQTSESSWEDSDLDPEEKRAISNYANHPAGILQGLKGAARSLERDLLVTKDVIVAISGELRESSSAEGAAKAVARHAPTIVLRPVIGASKAISQTLMGATNTMDPQNKRRIEDKYKRY